MKKNKFIAQNTMHSFSNLCLNPKTEKILSFCVTQHLQNNEDLIFSSYGYRLTKRQTHLECGDCNMVSPVQVVRYTVDASSPSEAMDQLMNMLDDLIPETLEEGDYEVYEDD
jgi:hypothetical protein